MTQFLLRRLLQSIFVIWGILTVVFVLVRLSGDPTTLFITEESTPQQVARVRAALGLDDPLHVQYFRYLSNAVRGEFGDSLRYRQPAMGLVLERIPISLSLLGAAVAFAIVIAVPLGILAAAKRGTIFDSFGMSVALLGQAIPSFWLGTMLVMLVAVQWKLLPTSGRGTPEHMILPMITLGAYLLARITRLVRSGLLEVLDHDFIRTARAKGLSEIAVVTRHALRHVGVAVLTVIALDVGALLAGAVVTETLFAWSGIGRLLVTAVSSRDFPIVQAAAIVLALFVVVINIIVDFAYSLIDPRVRVS